MKKYNCIFLLISQTTYSNMTLKRLTNQTQVKNRKLVVVCGNIPIKTFDKNYLGLDTNNKLIKYLFGVL